MPESLTERLTFRLTPSDRAKVEEAAELFHMDTMTFIRRFLMKKLEKFAPEIDKRRRTHVPELF